MLRKYKVILLNFDEILGTALCEWLNSIGDIDAKIETLSGLLDNTFANIIIYLAKSSDADIFETNLPKNIPLIAIGNKPMLRANSEITHLNLPLKFASLEASLRQILRNQADGQMAALNIANHVFNPIKRAFIGPNGKDLKLTDKEISILTYLNGANGASIGREELLREVWRYNQGVTTHTLETHIYRLRQKLSTLFGEREILITTEGGYRLQT